MTTGFRPSARMSVPAACAALLVTGCVSTLDIKSDEDLRKAIPDPVRVLTVERVEYELTTYYTEDSVLCGTGTMLTDAGPVPFDGAIPFSRIVYIQGTQKSVGRGLLAAGVIVTAAVLIGEAASYEGLTVYRPGGGSCPYVYAWNGEGFVIQGESFGTAFGRALETQTSCTLPDVAADGDLCIRLTNERPETHYLNSLRVRAFESPAGSTVVLDACGRAWPVRKPLGPVGGPEEIRARDGRRWRSDLSATCAGGDYRDRVLLTLPRSGNAAAGSVVVHAINTRLVNAVYDQVFGYLGDQSLRFLYDVEYDPALIRTLKGWIAECALAIEVWKGGSWVLAGTLLPEANEVPFTKLLRIDTEGMTGDSVLLRLSSLADTWEIDAVEVDWTPADALPETLCETLSAGHSAYGPAADRLRTADNAYVRLLPGEWVEVRSARRLPSDGGEISYALDAAGYLYEWIPGVTERRSPIAQRAALETDRVAAVRELISRRELFLPLVFANWWRVRFGLTGAN